MFSDFRLYPWVLDLRRYVSLQDLIENSRKKFPGGWKTLKPYVRIVCRRFFSSKRWAWKRSGEAFPGLLANCSLSELLEECQISSAEALSEPVIDWREKLVRVFCPTPTVPRRARQAPAPRRSRRGPLSAGPAYVPSPAAKRSPAR